MTLRCDNCGHQTERHHITRVQRLNPLNLEPEYRRHCNPCLKKTPEWRKVDYTRAYAESRGKTGGKPW